MTHGLKMIIMDLLGLIQGSNNNSNKLPEGKMDMEENRKGFFWK